MKLLPDDMRKKFLYIIFPALLLIPVISSGQDTEPPDPPLFTEVTINPATGNVDMRWSPSPSPDVAGYVVYEYDTIKKEGYYVDTIYDPAATSFSYDTQKILIKSVSYVVAAFDTSRNFSPLSNMLNTIYNSAVLDSCDQKINLAWNKYPSFPYTVTGYDILTSENGGNYELTAHVDANTIKYVVDSFTNGSSYCYIIRAVLANTRISSSSRSCLTARIQTPPQWINADYATVTNDGEITLSFTVDPLSETDLFVLERMSGESGLFEQIAIIRTGVSPISYTDKNANTGTVNFYRLAALNSCNTRVASSNLAANIVLANQAVNDDILLKWNGNHSWRGGVSVYRLFIDTGAGFTEYAVIQPSDTTYTVPLSDIIYSLSSGNVCFLVTATEGPDPYGVTGESSSNQSCYEITETVTVPNLFTPDGDLKNDLFRPVMTFTPSDYHLVISDRQSRVVFDTRNSQEAWDGTVNGSPLPQGVYIWWLRTRTLSGRNISRTGTITIYRNR